MRYTRTGQLARKQKSWKGLSNVPINYIREGFPEVDPTFKWVRNYLGCGNILKFRNAERMTCFMRAKDCKGVAKI